MFTSRLCCRAAQSFFFNLFLSAVQTARLRCHFFKTPPQYISLFHLFLLIKNVITGPGGREIIRSGPVHVYTLRFTPSSSLRHSSSDPYFLSAQSLFFMLFMSPSLAHVFPASTGCIVVQQRQQGCAAIVSAPARFLTPDVIVPDLIISSHPVHRGESVAVFAMHLLLWGRQVHHGSGNLAKYTFCAAVLLQSELCVSVTLSAPSASPCCLSPNRPKERPPFRVIQYPESSSYLLSVSVKQAKGVSEASITNSLCL